MRKECKSLVWTAKLKLVLLVGTTWQWPTPLFFSRLAQPGDETFLFCGGLWVGLFCVLFGFVVLVLFLVSICLIPFSSHKSCGVFQVSVEGHWTYSWTYVLVLRVSLRLFNLDCRYPRDLLQPARKKKDFLLSLSR